MLKIEKRKIEVEPTIEVSSMWAFPPGFSAATSPAFILAHGAGSDMDSPFLSFVHEALARSGYLSVKFNFPYIEEGRKAPDRTPRLLSTWRAVIEKVRTEARSHTLFIGGKSMGGRIASMVAAEQEDISGLALFGYPLHPAGRPDTLRKEHLPRIRCPMLFVQGSRDPLCNLDLLQTVLKPLTAKVTLSVIEEGDHSFKVPKRQGKSEREIWDSVVQRTLSWAADVGTGANEPGRMPS